MRKLVSPLCLKVVGLCVCWYTISSTGNVIEKLLLTNMPFPMTVAMFQLLSIALYLPPLLYLWNVPKNEHKIPRPYFLKWIIPLAVGKFISTFSARISIWKVPVSFAHTIKATLPLFTILISRFVLKEHHTTQVYVSLVVIVSGVIVASVTELSFDSLGFVSALVSTLVFAAQNIYSKKALKETGVHHFRLLLLLTRIAILIALPVWLFFDFFKIVGDMLDVSSTLTILLFNFESFFFQPSSEIDWSMALLYLLADGMCNFLQNKIAFSLIAMLSPIGYAVSNSSKRVAVIIISIFVLRNPVTNANITGMALALLGVFLYNKAKYDEYRDNSRLPQYVDRVTIPQDKRPGDLNGSIHHRAGFTPEQDTPSGWPMVPRKGLMPNEYSFQDLPQAVAAQKATLRQSSLSKVTEI